MAAPVHGLCLGLVTPQRGGRQGQAQLQGGTQEVVAAGAVEDSAPAVGWGERLQRRWLVPFIPEQWGHSPAQAALSQSDPAWREVSPE